jgi:hypothetical protein
MEKPLDPTAAFEHCRKMRPNAWSQLRGEGEDPELLVRNVVKIYTENGVTRASAMIAIRIRNLLDSPRTNFTEAVRVILCSASVWCQTRNDDSQTTKPLDPAQCKPVN